MVACKHYKPDSFEKTPSLVKRKGAEAPQLILAFLSWFICYQHREIGGNCATLDFLTFFRSDSDSLPGRIATT
jgi:hypothetical protein